MIHFSFQLNAMIAKELCEVGLPIITQSVRLCDSSDFQLLLLSRVFIKYRALVYKISKSSKSSLQPCGGWEVNDNSKVTLHSCDSLKGLILNGFIPLLHGDCVFDFLRGCTILSGDTIIQVSFNHIYVRCNRYVIKKDAFQVQ